MFDQRAFEELTPQCRGKVTYQRVIESTNDEARKDIVAGRASSGAIYLAEFQTGGKGRGGNSWVCPEGEGLLFSLVVDPDVDSAIWYRMSLAVGLAIVESVRELGLEVTMKWPNDIYLDDKKLGGILIEQVNELLIVGVGLNVNVQKFPDEVAERATSIWSGEGEEVNRELLLSKVVNAIYKNGSMIGEGFEYLIEQVMECFYLQNKQVSMMANDEALQGEVLGMSENGYLLLKEAGETGEMMEIHQAKEIKIIKMS